MPADERSEFYEQLKRLRRRDELSDGSSGHQTGPDEASKLFDVVIIGGGILGTLVASEAFTGKFAEADHFVRILDIRTLADRVFGDEKKAEIWLNRPNTSFSGQKPVDLLKDELGAAVVREALEQIDSGIFA
jgi:hypothetical protein